MSGQRDVEAASGPKKGAGTIKGAAVLFIASGLFELASLVEPVPLFGAMRGGVVTVLYHLLYLAGFTIVGIGLWRATRWGFKSVFWLTGAYTLDKLIYLFDMSARNAELKAATSSELMRGLGGIGGLDGGLIDTMRPQIFQMYTITALLVLASWWGFALYIYVRRAYFDR